MRLPNGFGSVHRVKGNRRKPWRARKTLNLTIDEEGKSRQKYIIIGYYKTKQEAMDALSEYNTNKYCINNVTFTDLYNRWSNEHFKEIVPSAIRTWRSAYNHSAPLHRMKMLDIKTADLEETIENAQVGDTTKARMKSLYNLMYRYALKHEIVNKNYADLCKSIKKPKPTIERSAFTKDEIRLLWENIDFPFVDMVLVAIYTGFRPQELAIIEIANVDLDNKIMIGGIKTTAGINRTVPIHPDILTLIKKRYDEATKLKSDKLFNDINGQQGTTLTYDKYRNRFIKITKRFNLNHRAHDTRHTFITTAKKCGVNEYLLKIIVGHAIKDITENTYTHRTVEDLIKEINKIKF